MFLPADSRSDARPAGMASAVSMASESPENHTSSAQHLNLHTPPAYDQCSLNIPRLDRQQTSNYVMKLKSQSMIGTHSHTSGYVGVVGSLLVVTTGISQQ